MQTAEFALAERIISCTRKWQGIYLKNCIKFEIELLKTVEQVLVIDAKNGNTLWADAISKELENVRVTFEILPDGKKVSIGHQFVQ